jgi:steroid 5-alpha reductase family enzyme
MLNYLLISLGVSLLINAILFAIAFRYKTDKVTDASYSLSFIVVALYALLTGPITAYRVVLTLLTVIWAARLGSFLVKRVWKTGKDRRFDEMRDSFIKFGQFWLLQAIGVWVIMIASLLALRTNHSGINLVAVIGIIIWFKGFIIEAVADQQKANFNANPKNKGHWIAVGVWKYSRHPNYFGEILVWVGTYLVAIQSLFGPTSLIALISPLFIASLLLFLSGIPILERNADAKWGQDPSYQLYKRRTSLLITMPQRKV